MNEYSQKDTLSLEISGESGDFRLTVRSASVSLSDFAEEEREENSMPVMARRRERPKVKKDQIENRTTASIRREAERLILSYEEAIDKDELPVPTVISFDIEEPGLVTLERKGFLRSVMIFEAGKRHRAVYKTPFASFEMTVFSRSVENALTPEGGTLRLVYCVEFKGVAEQKVELELEAVRL